MPKMAFNFIKFHKTLLAFKMPKGAPILLKLAFKIYCSLRKLRQASKQKVQVIKKEGKNSIEGAKYAAKKYLPPPSKMRSTTFHYLTNI